MRERETIRPGAILLAVGAMALVFALAGWAASAEPARGIDGPESAAPGDLVILSATAEAKAYAWTCIPDSKRWLAVDGGRRVVFASGAAGVYTFVLATATGDVPAVHQHVVTIGAPPPAPPPNPPPPPPPQPGDNPWTPAAAWQPHVAPIRALRLSREDATHLAAVYGRLSQPAVLATLPTRGDVRAALVRDGQALGLRGRYPGLAEAVDKLLVASIGLEDTAYDRKAAAEMFATLAWAVWETGRPAPPQAEAPRRDPLDEAFLEKYHAQASGRNWTATRGTCGMLGCTIHGGRWIREAAR